VMELYNDLLVERASLKRVQHYTHSFRDRLSQNILRSGRS
jgi:hypothetical protein